MPGVVVARVNMAPAVHAELIDAMTDSWSRYATQQGIKSLPETDGRD